MTTGPTESFEAVIGLEVHCELLTKTKLFCSCANGFGAEPNTNICPVCLGLPGSLPVLNERAVELAARIGLALSCTVQASVFHRKNYFYPDMPKDYQISQYDVPINANGVLELVDGSTIRIERAHLEEDTGKTTHVGGAGRINDAHHALIDYNRAGVPLVEIVSAPDIRSAEQARSYVSELRSILVATGGSDGRMEEGSLRVDANVSIRKVGSSTFGTRCEVKNLNSLRSLGRAIDYEIARQTELLNSNDRVVQETRHFDETTGTTSSMRSKEEAFDYRYFQEPDLVEFVPDEAFIEKVAPSPSSLPAARRLSLIELLDESARSEMTEQVATVVSLGLDDLVKSAVLLHADARLALTRTANEAAQDPERARGVDPQAFAELIALESSGKISATQSKTILGELVEKGGKPEEIASRLGFESLDSDEIGRVIDQLIAEHPDEWQRFCAGDEKVAQFLTGQIMRATKGKANGKVIAEIFEARRSTSSAQVNST